VRRWLAAPLALPDGTLQQRDRGTPQGSAVSPVIANLFLHYASGMWMTRTFPGVAFERYVDDAVIHCVSERQACEVRDTRYPTAGFLLTVVSVEVERMPGRRSEPRPRLILAAPHPTSTRNRCRSRLSRFGASVPLLGTRFHGDLEQHLTSHPSPGESLAGVSVAMRKSPGCGQV
jgi:hypothetical protein